MPSNRSTGFAGEQMASDYLKRQGYEILCRNFREKFAEIDIVARRGEVLCFVEVKARNSTEYGLPCEAVDWKKQMKIRRLAEVFLQVQDISYEEIRFDIVEVYLKDGYIRHLEDVF